MMSGVANKLEESQAHEGQRKLRPGWWRGVAKIRAGRGGIRVVETSKESGYKSGRWT